MVFIIGSSSFCVFPKQLFCKAPIYLSNQVNGYTDPKLVDCSLFENVVYKTQTKVKIYTFRTARPKWKWLLWIMGSKHTGFPAWRFHSTVASLYGVFCFTCFPGPSQSEVVSYFWSWDQTKTKCMLIKTYMEFITFYIEAWSKCDQKVSLHSGGFSTTSRISINIRF